jgi:hypothetical protein
MLNEWQKSCKVAETGKFSHFIFPRVSLRPWFEEWRTERKLITTVLRIISGHCGVRAHLKRFSIVDGSMCVCLEDHETVDHIIWKSMPDLKVITIWCLRGDLDTKLVCPIELERSKRVFYVFR